MFKINKEKLVLQATRYKNINRHNVMCWVSGSSDECSGVSDYSTSYPMFGVEYEGLMGARSFSTGPYESFFNEVEKQQKYMSISNAMMYHEMLIIALPCKIFMDIDASDASIQMLDFVNSCVFVVHVFCIYMNKVVSKGSIDLHPIDDFMYMIASTDKKHSMHIVLKDPSKCIARNYGHLGTIMQFFLEFLIKYENALWSKHLSHIESEEKTAERNGRTAIPTKVVKMPLWKDADQLRISSLYLKEQEIYVPASVIPKFKTSLASPSPPEKSTSASNAKTIVAEKTPVHTQKKRKIIELPDHVKRLQQQKGKINQKPHVVNKEIQYANLLTGSIENNGDMEVDTVKKSGRSRHVTKKRKLTDSTTTRSKEIQREDNQQTGSGNNASNSLQYTEAKTLEQLTNNLEMWSSAILAKHTLPHIAHGLDSRVIKSNSTNHIALDSTGKQPDQLLKSKNTVLANVRIFMPMIDFNVYPAARSKTIRACYSIKAANVHRYPESRLCPLRFAGYRDKFNESNIRWISHLQCTVDREISIETLRHSLIQHLLPNNVPIIDRDSEFEYNILECNVKEEALLNNYSNIMRGLALYTVNMDTFLRREGYTSHVKLPFTPTKKTLDSIEKICSEFARHANLQRTMGGSKSKASFTHSTAGKGVWEATQALVSEHYASHVRGVFEDDPLYEPHPNLVDIREMTNSDPNENREGGTNNPRPTNCTLLKLVISGSRCEIYHTTKYGCRTDERRHESEQKKENDTCIHLIVNVTTGLYYQKCYKTHCNEKEHEIYEQLNQLCEHNGERRPNNSRFVDWYRKGRGRTLEVPADILAILRSKFV